MNRLGFISYLLCTLVWLSGCSVNHSSQVEDSLERLDVILAESELYETQKEERIQLLKERLNKTEDDESRYWILDDIFSEYNKYDLDSTIRYATLKHNLAIECNDEYCTYDAIFDVAEMYIMSGMYHEATKLIGTTDSQALLNKGLLPRYFHLMNGLYGGLAHTSEDINLKEIYQSQKQEYREKLYNNLGDDDISKLYIRTEMLIDSLKYDEAITGMKQWSEISNINIHDKAIINYMSGVAYKRMNDIENALICYTESAICDLMTPIRDYKSLYELAELLYKKGDFERASRYITRSLKDAEAANIHINIESINANLPIIYNSYASSIKSKNKLLYILVISTSILLILLAIATCLTIRNRKRIEAKEREVRESNIELTKVNERLQRYISRLKESNEIKETYISRYIDLCSDYIGRLDQYRSELRQISKKGGFEAVQKELRSNEVIEKELSEFYAQFDATFLELFPDFIPQLNSLLQNDKQLETKDGLMTTELRVCALIRLGVTDSVKIAEFLRRSVSTIYNYRVKMRNSALNKREDFEKEIMKIGKIS